MSALSSHSWVYRIASKLQLTQLETILKITCPGKVNTSLNRKWKKILHNLLYAQQGEGKLGLAFNEMQIDPFYEGKSTRLRACEYAFEATNKWKAQLLGYQRMPDEELFAVQVVQLKTPVDRIISQAGRKAMCNRCSEEIINEREVIIHGATFCKACAGDSYYDLSIFDVASITNKFEIG